MEENQVPTPMEAVEITDDDKLWALLGWITGVVALIALLMDDKKARPFIKYNAVMALVVIVVLSVLVSILSVITCGIGAVTAIAYIYPIYLGIKSYQGNWVEVPWLTDFVKKQGWAWAP
ncbi:MAG: hypothetical protein JXA09_09265 [Anaerolineae bacterium]|nr:hypothetical protein [Anaerolineae bacterium]